MTKKVGVFHRFAGRSLQTALAFQEQEQLGWYATSIFYDPQRWPYKIERILPKPLAVKVRREFSKHAAPFLDISNVRQFGTWEWFEACAYRIGWWRMQAWLNERDCRHLELSVIKLMKTEPVDVIWGRNCASLEAFRWAKKRGLKCILDQTIGHPATRNPIILAEKERHPEFFITSYKPFSQEWIDRQNEEVELADVVVAGSDFCAQTMTDNGCPPEKIRVIGYGYDDSMFPPVEPIRQPLDGRPINFLFVGTIEPRKGVQYLLQAFENLPRKDASLTLVGPLSIPRETFARFADRVHHVDKVPKAELGRHYLAADCLVFPSLFEGSAKVLIEACGAGLGIIQSSSAGNGVREGRNGIVLTGELSAGGLAEAVSFVVDNRQKLREWQQASWALRNDWTWASYRKRIRSLIND